MNQFGMRFEDCATVLFVLAFHFQSQANENWYNWDYWDDVFKTFQSDPSRLDPNYPSIIKYFETHHLRAVLELGSRNVKVITPSGGVGPQRREMNEYDKSMIRTSEVARQQYHKAGLWQEFKVIHLEEFEVENHREEFGGGPGFMKSMFVVAILVGIIFILHRRRSVVYEMT